MKVVQRNILSFQEKVFFSPLRDKIDYARLIVFSARMLLTEEDIQRNYSNSYMKLIINKMSRLFFYKDNKFFSISFPFNVSVDFNNVIEITTYSGKRIDHKSISSINTILEDHKFKLNPSLFNFWENSESSELIGISLLEEIFQFEPAYIRYDEDHERHNGKIHPLYHIDINYSSHGTYKLGLSKSLIETSFENILDIQTECFFLTGHE